MWEKYQKDKNIWINKCKLRGSTIVTGNKIREDEMEGSCSMHRRHCKCIQILGCENEEVAWLIKIRLNIFLKWTIKKQSVSLWTWFLWRQDPIACSCKQSNKHFLGHIKYAPFSSSWAAVNFARRSLLQEEKNYSPAGVKTLSIVAGVSVGIDIHFLYSIVSALHFTLKRFPQTITLFRNICALEDFLASSCYSSIPRSFPRSRMVV